jgi:hypothetical protein
MPQYNPRGPRRWPSQHVHEHTCAECGAKFPAVAIQAELCSGKCRVRKHRRLRRENARERVTT